MIKCGYITNTGDTEIIKKTKKQKNCSECGCDIITYITPFSLKNGTLDSKKNIIAPTRA